MTDPEGKYSVDDMISSLERPLSSAYFPSSSSAMTYDTRREVRSKLFASPDKLQKPLVDGKADKAKKTQTNS